MECNNSERAGNNNSQTRTIELVDEDLWNFYSSGEGDELQYTMGVAQAWAERMQEYINAGKQIDDIWLLSLEEAAGEVTLRELHKIIGILARTWVHGKLLSELYQATR